MNSQYYVKLYDLYSSMQGIISKAYKELNPGERALSIVSVQTLLAMLGYGASGITLERLLTLFGIRERHEFLRFLQNLNADDIKNAKAIFFDSSRNVIRIDYYQSISPYVSMFQLDFNDPDAAVHNMNNWIEANSGLSNVVPRSAVQKAGMIAVNALWFKDQWSTKFSKSMTTMDTFTKDTGSVIQLPMMRCESSTQYYVDNGVSMVRLHFRQSAYAEFIMGIPSQEPVPLNFPMLITDVITYLPKFSATFNNSLLPLIGKLGLESMKWPGFANLVDQGDLQLSDIIQKLEVTFDEIGAEVKVATVSYACAMGPPRIKKQPIIIKFNQPFHYRIVKNGLFIVEGWYNGDKISSM